jgi:membrane fusion protein (multidrug efflux system)
VILKRLFTEGGDVTAGEPLYQIDPATYQATYDSANATLAYDIAALATAKAKAARYAPLASAQAVSEQDYDDAHAAALEAQATVAEARASLEQARINLQYTKVLSPISGTISASSVTPGALVTAEQTTALATVTQLDPIYVDLNESSTTWLRLKQEMDAGQLHTEGANAAKITLTLEDGSTYALPGQLQFSEVQVDEGTGTVLVRALFPNPQHLLLPGMYVHAELQEGVNPNGILVPQQALSRNTHGDATVLVVGDGNKVTQRVIQTGPAVGSEWIVTGGLQRGERVIVDGLLKAQPGMTVVPVPETAPSTSS